MKPIDRLPVVVTGLVAVAAAILAVESTSEVALASDAVSNRACSFLVPAIIEGGAIVAGLSAWRRSRAGLGSWRDSWLERIMLGATLALAVVTNAAHALGAHPRLLGVVLAGAAPIILLACVEVIVRAREIAERDRVQEAVQRALAEAAQRAERARMAEVEARRVRAQARKTARAGATQGDVVQRVGMRDPAQTRPRPVASTGGDGDDLDQVRRLLAERPGITGKDVARAIGKHEATGRRLLARVRAETVESDVSSEHRDEIEVAS